MEHSLGGGLAMLIWLALVTALFCVPLGMVLRKAGFSPWWALLGLIPGINLVMLWVFALSRWPIEGNSRDQR